MMTAEQFQTSTANPVRWDPSANPAIARTQAERNARNALDVAALRRTLAAVEHLAERAQAHGYQLDPDEVLAVIAHPPAPVPDGG